MAVGDAGLRTSPIGTFRTSRRPRVGVAGWAPIAGRVLVPVVGLALGGVPSAVAALAFQEIGLWIARRIGRELPGAAWIFLGAFVLQAVVGFVVFTVLEQTRGRGTWFQDDELFDVVGHWLVRIEQGEGMSVFPSHTY